jgi:glutamate/tyrosine decarboxylase-like PLP-dependent enzyme
MMHVDHPRFFAFVPGPGSFVGAMADALAAGFNVFAGTWFESSGPAEIELVTLDWLRAACGLPETAGGLFVSGGSVANITALAVARHIGLQGRPDGVVYCSDQTHSSVERGLRVLGFRPDQLCTLPSGPGYELDLEALRRTVSADRLSGRTPFCVVANAGTTNTGAVDPLPALASYCRDENLWLHVDGAYGAAAILCERGRALLTGLADAHSLTLDPHKWLFQPYEMGCVLVRDSEWLDRTFHILPEYLVDASGRSGEVNFCDRGIQLTRAFRALKLWMSVKVFGWQAFRAAIAAGFEHAELAEAEIRTLAGWEVVTPAQMAVVTFRYAPSDLPAHKLNALNQALVEDIIADGFALVTSTVLRGQTVLRMCTINPRSIEADISETVRRLDQAARRHR